MSDLFTYEDAVSYLLNSEQFDRSTYAHRQALWAIQKAYRDFPNRHRWSYFQRRGQIHTVETQATGTVVYDQTGGTYERELTLSGATWPTVDDVRLYKIIIGQNTYEIEDVKSTTVLTLSALSNPGQDVASTSYTLFKSKFHLPVSFRKMASPLLDLGRSYALGHVEPDELLEHLRGNWQPQEPNVYTIKNGGETYGGFLVEMAPPPNQSRTWDYIFEASPRPLKIERYATGTVSTDGTTTVSGTGTSWTSKMVGSIIRFPASGTTPPGGIAGGIVNISGTDTELDPFDEQRVVVDVTATNSLTVDVAVSTRTGVGYTISDPIDMEPGTMASAFLRLCEAEFARFAKMDRTERNERDRAAHHELILAMGADNRQRDLGMGGSDKSQWGLKEWAINEAYGGSPLT